MELKNFSQSNYNRKGITKNSRYSIVRKHRNNLFSLKARPGPATDYTAPAIDEDHV